MSTGLGVAPTNTERAATLPGDDIVPDPDVVMDRGFSLPGSPERVWPWFVQLGKRRAGWYLPRGWERFVPPQRRALRRIEPAWQGLAVGDVIPDWGGAHATFEIVQLQPPGDGPGVIVYRSQRGRVRVSWAILLHRVADDTTRVQLRLRLAPVRRRRLAEVGGGLVDLLTIAGLAAGLRERVRL